MKFTTNSELWAKAWNGFLAVYVLVYGRARDAPLTRMTNGQRSLLSGSEVPTGSSAG